MATIDQNSVIPDAIDQNAVIPDGPPKPRGALSEIGTGALRGVLSGAPEGIGKTLQFLGADQVGGAVRQFGEDMGQKSWLQARPEGHGMVTNTLAQAAEGLGSFAPVIAASFVNPIAGAVLGGEQMAGAAGQDTLEKAQAKGVSPQAADEAARLNSMQSFVTGVAGGFVGGKALGVLGGPVSRALGMEGKPLAEGILNDLTGQSGVMKPFLRQLPISAAEATGVMTAQAGAQAGIEQHYGIDDTDPLTAMGQAIGPALGLTAVASPLALAARAMGVKAARDRTATLASEQTSPEVRIQLADQYATALSKVNPEAGLAFRQNAERAIVSKQGLTVDPTMMQPDAVQWPVNPMAEAAKVPQLTYNPTPQQQVVFPDGTVGTQAQAEAYIAGLPEDQQLAARAKLFGYGAEPAGPEQPPGVAGLLTYNPTQPPQEPFIVSPDGAVATPEQRAQVEANIASLPENEQVAARAKLMGYGAQPVIPNPLFGRSDTPLLENNPTPQQVTPQGQVIPRMFTLPDGTQTNDHNAVNEAITALKPSERPAAWARAVGVETDPAANAQEAAQHAQEVDNLHGQVKDALTEAGIPLAQPMDKATFGEQNNLKGQALAKAYKAYLVDPATQEALMREDAASYEKMAAEREAAPAPSLNPLADNAKPEERTNTQLADAMNDALRQKQVDDAYAAYDAHREAERDAIANRTAGEAEAAAAERGEVTGDANAPKQTGEITRDADSVKQASEGAAGPTMRAFDKRVNTLGLDGLDSHQAQIDALQAAIDKGGMSADVQTMMQKLVDRWKADMPKVAEAQPEEAKPAPAEPAPAPAAPAEAPKAPAAQPELGARPAQADTLGKNIETPSPATSEPPPATETTSEAMPGGLHKDVRQQAKDALTRLNTLGAEFADRVNKKGEKLSELEQQRWNEVNRMRYALNDVVNGEMNNTAYMERMVELADQLHQPFDKPLEKLAADERVDPALAAITAKFGPLSDALAHLAQNGSTPGVKAIAQRLRELGLKTQLHANWLDDGTAGRYSPQLDRAEINMGHESEETVMHEAIHAGLYHTIDQASRIDTPRTQREAQLKQAYKDLEDVRQGALKHSTPEDNYGLTDAQEFAAELGAKPAFQEFLRNLRADGGKQSLWSKAIDAVRRLLGLKVDARDALEKSMDAFNVLMDSAKNSKEFDASPAGAVRATDDTLVSFAKVADRVGERIPMDTISRGLFRNMLGWKTVDFIAHQVRGVPDMVKTGFADAVDAYRAARDSRRIAAEHLGATLGQYSADVQRTLRATADPRGWGEKMMRIGGSAAIGQFDYRKNFADNTKAVDQGGGGRTLDASMKAHVDEIHRQFKQLEQAQPALAKALVDGEKQNRKMLIQQVATLASNLISAQTGVVPRLEAELARLPLEDANRAKLQQRIQLAQLDATLAAKHLPGLDFMDPALKTAKNGLPDFHLDGASSALGARMSALFKDVAELPNGTALKGPLGELARLYNPQVKNPYFSLGRSGDHFVNIAFKGPVNAQTAAKLNAALEGTNKVLGNLDGQTHAFFRVDTLDQAQGLYNKLLQAGGDAIDGPASARGRLADTDMQTAAGISPAIRQLAGALNDAVDMHTLNATQAADMKRALTSQLLSMLPETAARSAKMERRGVPGYDGDFAANFAKRASGTVQDLSNIYTNRAFGAAQEAMKSSVERMNRGEASADNAARAQSVADEVNTRYANGMKPVDNTHVNLLNAFGHTFYLAASPAFYIRTMAQPYHRGLPILGARYGFVSAAKEIAGATGTAVKIIGNTIREGWADEKLRGVMNTGMRFDNLGLSKQDQGFVQELHDLGILKLGQAQQLQHAISGASQRQQDVARLASMTAQYAEMTNRLAVGLAAFRMGMRDTKIQSMDARTRAATDFAVKAVNNAMDNFDVDNTARQIGKHGIAGKVTPLLTSFMNYNLQTMQQVVRTVQDGYFAKGALPGETADAFKQRTWEAKKEFMGLMGTTAVIAGAMGLPFANAFAGVYNSIHQLLNPDDPSDIRQDVRNWISSWAGDTGGDIISHGVGHLINMDTSTFGLENLLPGSEFLASRQQLKDRIESQSQNLLGPAINAGLDVVAGVGKMIDGNYVKGLEAMLPSGLKPYYKSIELATRGYTDSKGNPLPFGENGTNEAGAWDIGLQAAGFRTAEKADRDERAFNFSQSQELLQARRAVLGDRFYKAVTANDADAQQSALSDIQDFNAANPFQPMRDLGSEVRRRMMELAVGNAGGFGMTLTKRQLPVATKAFGGMPERE